MSYIYIFWLVVVGLFFGYGLLGVIVGVLIGFVLDNMCYSQCCSVVLEVGGFICLLFVLFGVVVKSDGCVLEVEIVIVECLMICMGLEVVQ